MDGKNNTAGERYSKYKLYILLVNGNKIEA